MLVLEDVDEKSGDDEADDEVESEVEGGEEAAALETVELSLNLMVGFTPPQTMKVRGHAGASADQRSWS